MLVQHGLLRFIKETALIWTPISELLSLKALFVMSVIGMIWVIL